MASSPTSTPRSLFLNIHTLCSYPGTLLNRDDAGFAKRLPFGGATRTRISSQCLKRHWRTFDRDARISMEGLEQEPSLRSRYTFHHHVVEPLLGEGLERELVIGATMSLMSELLKLKPVKREKNEPFEDFVVQTPQLTVFGQPEVEYLREVTRGVVEEFAEQGLSGVDPDAWTKEQKKVVKEVLKSLKDLKKNLGGMVLASGLSAALFGRMVTSDILARGDAAIHVAHALTVHTQQSETDYFTAVDELPNPVEDGDELGSAHINTTELTSGLFYGFVVIDVPLLVSNLTGAPASAWMDEDRTLAAEVVRRLIHLIATVSPGAKLGSTAPYARPDMVLVEATTAQPRTLANAFFAPVSQRGDLRANTFEALSGYMSELRGMFDSESSQTTAALAGLSASEGVAGVLETSRVSVDAVATWAAEQVTQGVA